MSYFDEAAATWDNEPRRIELMKAIGEAIVREARPDKTMDVLDYGCGTGLVGLYLLPHVHSVTGADNSSGMLEVLRTKVREGGITGMKAIQLDLEKEPVPKDQYHMVVSSMVMRHVIDVGRVLSAFHETLHPGGVVCIADLDTEPGIFHPAEAAVGVRHHGFDRHEFMDQLAASGFEDIRATTAHVIQKPVEGGELRDFPVFLMIGRR